MDPVSLKSSGHSLSLVEVIHLNENQPLIDQSAIFNLIDRPSPSNRYTSSTARREARKLDTQKKYESWQKKYRELKRKHTGMSDNWCALQIAKMLISQGKDSETIRKNMKG